MNRVSAKRSLSAKLTAVYSILILIVSGTLTFSLYWQLRTAQRQAIRERLHDILSFAAPLVDGDFHALIRLPEDEASPFYRVVSVRLKSIQATSGVIKRIYTLRQAEDGRLTFVVDVGPVTRAHVGQVYPRASPLLARGLPSIPGPVVEDALHADSSGIFLSGYAPIYDQFRNLDGVLGIDIDAGAVIASETQARQAALLAFLATAPLSLLLGWWLARHLTSPLIDLVRGTERIAQGHLDQDVPVRSHDEIGVLAQVFNEMAVQLRRLISDLERRVAELKQTQAALRRSEAKYRELVQSANSIILQMDTGGRVTFFNRFAQSFFGYAENEILGQSVVGTIVPPVDTSGRDLAAMIEDIIQHPERYANNENENVRRDGERVWVAWTNKAVLDNDGRITGTLCIGNDITERVRAEGLIRAQHDLALKLGAAVGLDEMLRLCVEAAIRSTGMDAGGGYLVNEVSGELNLTFSKGLSPDFVKATSHFDADSANARLVMAGKPIYINCQELDVPIGEVRHCEGLRVAAILPVHYEGQVIACLNIASRFLGEIPPAARDTLEMMAAQIGSFVARARAEEALRESEARLQSIFRAAPTGIGLVSNHVLLRVNDKICDMLGYSSDELIGKSARVLYATGEEFEYVGREKYAQIRERGTGTVETRLRRKDGEVIDVLLSSTPLNPADLSAGVTFTALDITERVRAEAEILRLQRLFQNVTDSMPSTLITLDPTGRVLTWNPAAEALTGQAADQVRGQRLWESCPELACYRDLFEQVVREGQVAHRHKEQVATETGTVYRDVSVFPLEANDTGSTGSPRADSTSSPRVEGAVLRIDDVTRRVQMEETMLQSAKLASVGGLAAGVAHEINNPLSAMIQSAQVLQIAFDTQRPRTRERLQACGVEPEGLNCYLQERALMDYLDGIRTTGGRAAKIVSDLLTFSRQAPFQARPRDLNALVEQTLELAATDYDLRRKYDFRDIEIVREFAPDLPQVVCDSQQIQQVVLNLVRNAAQAMAAERSEWRIANSEWQPRLTLRTAYREEIRDPQSETLAPARRSGASAGVRNRMVRLEVEDNGPGIPEAVRARLFEPFFTTKEVGEGTGLGLWLCWSIVVERHGGQIWAEPGRDDGSRFVVELPVI